MGQEMELDLHEKSSVGLSPNTVLPPHQYGLNVKKRYKKVKPTGKEDFLTLKVKNDFSEIKFARFRSASCKSILSRHHGPEGNIEMRRDSMYQSSEEVKNIQKMGTFGGRKKIEISSRSDTSLSCSIVDSLCSSDYEDSRQRSSVISQDSNLSLPSVSESCARMETNCSDGFIEICINSDVREKYYSAAVGRDTIDSKVRSDKVSGSLIDGNPSLDKDTVHKLQKSISAKVEVSHLLSPSESGSSRASPRVRFTPIRKRFNPFTKSKSLRSPVSHMLETSEVKSTTGTANIPRSRTSQKSLLNNFSSTAKHSDIISEFINRDIQHSGIARSPVHLHGNLKLENKHGVPFFEFKVKCPEDVFVAKTWRVDNAFNWVYTFHSIDSRKKSNATGLGSRDCDKDSSIVAQMLVSCNLCPELKDGVFGNSMMTEFVLYDLAPSRQSGSHKKASNCDQDAPKTMNASHLGLEGKTFKLDEENLAIKNQLQQMLPSGNVDFDDSNSYRWLSSELHPNLEIAAIVLQIPFHKRESIKYERGKRISAKPYPSLIDLSVVDQSRKSLHDNKSQEQVKVVIPAGSHGLPDAESQGPSSLLDRWRLGGGCDCGGWDMACPLILLGNPGIQFAEDHSLMGNHHPLELFVQGAKESTPTFSMRVVEEGQYSVDFHAKLSTLQAFSICVAILHGSSTFSSAGQEKKQQLSQCNSLKMLIEEDVDFLFESVTREKTVPKTQKGIPRSYVLNPPFSPIARV